MKIQNKLFLCLFGFSLVSVTILVLVMQWSIGKGMVKYVASKEIETLKPVVSKLSEEYQTNNSWHSMDGKHRKLRHLILKQLEGSDFEPTERQLQRPPEHRQLDKPNTIAPPCKGEGQYTLMNIDVKLIAGNYIEA